MVIGGSLFFAEKASFCISKSLHFFMIRNGIDVQKLVVRVVSILLKELLVGKLLALWTFYVRYNNISFHCSRSKTLISFGFWIWIADFGNQGSCWRGSWLPSVKSDSVTGMTEFSYHSTYFGRMEQSVPRAGLPTPYFESNLLRPS